MDSNLRRAVIDTLATFGGTMKSPPSDAVAAGKMWLAICARHAVTVDEFKEVALRLAETCKFHPAPAEFVETLEALREEARSARAMNLGLAVGTAPDGSMWAAPPELIESGEYLGELPEFVKDGRVYPELIGRPQSALDDLARRLSLPPGQRKEVKSEEDTEGTS